MRSPGTFRQALLMEKPSALMLLLGWIFPIHDVIRWEVREEMLDKLARDLGDHGPWPSTKLIAHLQDLAGRDWPKLHEELRERWSRRFRR